MRNVILNLLALIWFLTIGSFAILGGGAVLVGLPDTGRAEAAARASLEARVYALETKVATLEDYALPPPVTDEAAEAGEGWFSVECVWYGRTLELRPAPREFGGCYRPLDPRVDGAGR